MADNEPSGELRSIQGGADDRDQVIQKELTGLYDVFDQIDFLSQRKGIDRTNPDQLGLTTFPHKSSELEETPELSGSLLFELDLETLYKLTEGTSPPFPVIIVEGEKTVTKIEYYKFFGTHSVRITAYDLGDKFHVLSPLDYEFELEADGSFKRTRSEYVKVKNEPDKLVQTESTEPTMGDIRVIGQSLDMVKRAINSLPDPKQSS